MLPQKLRETFGLDEEAMFAGMGEHFQVWAPAEYRGDMEALEDLPGRDDLLAALDAVGREDRS